MRILIIAAALALAGCGAADEGGNEAGNAGAESAALADETAVAGAANGANAAAGAPAGLGPCPFRRTSGWNGSVEGGRLLVGGEVDLMMAGMRPDLAERPGSGGSGTIALDLTMVPEAQALTNRARFERAGASGLRRGEIWCGGERIADFDLILID